MKNAMGIAMAMLCAGFLAGCGADDSSGGNTTMTRTSTSKDTMQTCDEKHVCVNSSCKCTAGPKNNFACCDPNDDACSINKCDTYCQYCM